MSACRSCGAAILWVEGPTGRAMPLDWDPSPKGNVIVAGGMAEVHRGPVLGGRMPHHATCPQGESWRKRP